MRFPFFSRIVSVGVTASLLGMALVPAASAYETLEKRLPTAEKNIFILDISGSTNSVSLWKNSLRPSIIRRLTQPFGMPEGSSASAPAAPLDISVSFINSQSVDAPSFPIVTQQDAQRIWGVVEEIGERPSSERLDVIVKDIFGGGGPFAKQAQFLKRSTITPPSASDCENSMVNSFRNGQYMGNLELPKKKSAARVFCSTLIGFGKRIIATDHYLVNPDCGSSTACSDIAGAILKANYAAMDAYQLNHQSKFCVAIASDMLNNYPGMAADSPLNSQKIALSAISQQQAKAKGIEAANAVGIRFPKGMKVRVSIMGQGSGSKPLPLEKNSMLTAYWQGFWEGAGINSSNQVRSLDQACSF